MWSSEALLCARDEAFGRRRWLDELSPKQRAFFADDAKLKAATAGRRGGKTWACCVGLYEAADKSPGALQPYVCLSSVSARRIMWPVLAEQNERYGWGLKLDNAELVARHPNGSQIFAVGGDNRRKIEALRGGKYGRVVIDECGSFPGRLLEYLVDDVLEAALMDLEGDMWLAGSPNAACAGTFFELTEGGAKGTGVKIPTHHWTALDNTAMPHAERWLEALRVRRGWTKDHPTYRREYLGQWVRDMTWLVFRYNAGRHFVDAAPKVDRAILAIDLGASLRKPTTAFVVCGWRKHDRTVYVLHAEKPDGLLSPSQIAQRAKELMADYPISEIVIDEGGLGGGYSKELQVEHRLNVSAAEKRQKKVHIEYLNDRFDLNQIQIVRGKTGDLVDEIEILQWDEARKEYDIRFNDHCADAFLYAWRACWAWSERDAPAPKPEQGTAEAALAWAAQEKAKAIREASRRERQRTSQPGWWQAQVGKR